MAVVRHGPATGIGDGGRPTGPRVSDIGPAAAGVSGLGGRVAGLIEEDREERRKPRDLCPEQGCMTRTGDGSRCRYHGGEGER